MKRRTLYFAALTAGLTQLLLSQEASAQRAEPTEGKEYSRLDPPQPAPADGRVEVLEFFSYACPACNAFDPSLASWSRTLPNDVRFRRVPVPFLANAPTFQRTYYALETMGMLEPLHAKLFSALHVERQRLSTPEDIAALVAKNGASANAFLSAFNSFSVVTAVNRAKKMANDYGIESIPTLAIQGRFVTSPGLAGGAAQTLAVADALIRKSRRG